MCTHLLKKGVVIGTFHFMLHVETGKVEINESLNLNEIEIFLEMKSVNPSVCIVTDFNENSDERINLIILTTFVMKNNDKIVKNQVFCFPYIFGVQHLDYHFEPVSTHFLIKTVIGYFDSSGLVSIKLWKIYFYL